MLLVAVIVLNVVKFITMVTLILTAIICFVILTTSHAFLNPTTNAQKLSSSQLPVFAMKYDKHVEIAISRNEFGALFAASLLVIPNISIQQASAAMMEQPKEKFFEIGVTLSADIAKARFQDARRTVVDLVNNYDSIIKDGGDNVRRYLGTVGTTSAMYGIEKVLKDLQNEANDIVAYTENMDDFVYYLRAADTAVYSANFVEFSAAKTKPEKFFDDAKSDCKNILLHMDNMANELNL
jgi:hypothetical protein